MDFNNRFGFPCFFFFFGGGGGGVMVIKGGKHFIGLKYNDIHI